MHAEGHELRLGDEPDAVPRARAFVASVVPGLGPSTDRLVPDVELAVAELVTNALLYAGPPVLLRLIGVPDAVRVEVQDSSAAAPVRARISDDAMTGRGLALLEAVAPAWGVDRVPTGGKVVWAEVRNGHGGLLGGSVDAMDVDALLAAWDDRVPGGRTYTVRLGDVPTDLLLSAKAHVDNLVREFTLAASGAASGHSASVPLHLANLIETVVHRFAEARQAIKRQALAAAARGDERTELTLELSADAADAGEDYLAALDAADSYSRAARLLTLETPPQHRLFRRWYVESLVDQLRRTVAGENPPPPQTLEQRLLAELQVVLTAQRASDRAARLQKVTAALAAATTTEEVAGVVVSEGVSALGASGGSIVVPDNTGHLAVLGSVGYEQPLLDRLRAESREAQLPAAVAMRTLQPVWLESRQERDTRFPELTGMEPGTVSMCAVPLVVGGRLLGALRLSFDSPRLFDDDERAFVSALAAQTAQAVERSNLYAAERAARDAAEGLADRLARLQQLTAALTGAADVEAVADIVVSHVSEVLGSPLASLSLLEDEDTLRVVRMRGATEQTVRRWQSYPVAANLPASVAVRTNKPVIVRSRAEMEERFPLLAGQSPVDRWLICLPLSVGRRRLGALTLSFERGEDGLDDPERVRFLGTLGEACSQAVARAQALADAREATGKLTFLAEASAELSRSLDYRTTLTNVARLVVPRLADWCSIQVVEDGALRTVAITHMDPEKVAFALELQQRYPQEPDAPTGAAHVVRTGESELVPAITDDVLQSIARDDEHLAMMRRLGLASSLVVPLVSGGRTLGVISMVTAESGRHFSATDLTLAEDLARRAAVAVEHATAFREQTGRLAEITRVAEVVQHAILPPVPSRAGELDISTSYVSASREALVGGDLYEIAVLPGAVRLVIGDVKGKGLDAVRLATVVLGEFRAAAVDRAEIADVARQMDARLRPYLGDEDFVTALIAEIRADGTAQAVCCGHPPALLWSGGRSTYVGETATVPLGLGAEPATVTFTLTPGDRLLLYTDGLLEARDQQGEFISLDRVAAPLREGAVDTVLDRIHHELREAVGSELSDDLALLLVQYRPEPHD